MTQRLILTEEEKRNIQKMYGMINEQEETNFDKNYFMSKKTGTVTFSSQAIPLEVDGIKVSDYKTQWKRNFKIENIGGRGFQPGVFTWTYGEEVPTGVMGYSTDSDVRTSEPGISIKDSANKEVGTLIFELPWD